VQITRRGALLVEPGVTGIRGEGRTLHFKVNVIEATVGWGAGFFSENEHSKVELEVEVFDADRSVAIFQGTGASWGKHSSMDTNKQAPYAMLEGTFVSAFEDFLYREETIQGINVGLQRSSLQEGND
jgi:hypothetical protein